MRLTAPVVALPGSRRERSNWQRSRGAEGRGAEGTCVTVGAEMQHHRSLAPYGLIDAVAMRRASACLEAFTRPSAHRHE